MRLTNYPCHIRMPAPTEYCYESPFDINVSYVNIRAQPRSATIGFEFRGKPTRLTVMGPKILSSIAGLFDELWQIRIADQNLKGSQLEFGRYEIQLWDEDGPYASFQCDNYELDSHTESVEREHAG